MSTRAAGLARVGCALALALASCAAPSDEDALATHAHDLDFDGAITGPIFVAPPSIEHAVDRARAAQWPLPEPAEIELAALASAWRAEVQRALFARGLALAEAPGAQTWTLALELLYVSPDDRWLNAVGAEDRLTAGTLGPSPGTALYSYTLRDPGHVAVLARNDRRAFEPDRDGAARRVADAGSWSSAGRRALLASAPRIAAQLRPTDRPAQ